MKTNRVTGTLHEDQCTFLLLSPSFLLKLKKFQTSCRENRNTHFIFNDFFENRAFYEIILKNSVDPGRTQMTIWRMSITCLIPKAKQHTLRICNTYYFSTANMVTRTRLNVTLYVHCLSCIHRSSFQLHL